MKNTLFSIIALVFVSTSALAQQGVMPGPEIHTVNLEKFQMDKGYNADNLNLDGSVSVNFDEKIVSLTVAGGTKCVITPISNCPLDYRLLIHENLPLEKVLERSDGVQVYVAKRDLMPVDGAKSLIYVYDFRYQATSKKRKFKTVVVYKRSFYDRLQGELVNEKSVLKGKELIQINY